MRRFMCSLGRPSALAVAVCALVASGVCGATAAGEAGAPNKPELLVIPEGAGALIIEDQESEQPPVVCDVDIPLTEGTIPDACITTAALVTVTAVPDPGVPGARFDRWSDYRCPEEPVCTLSITENRSLSALFSPVFLRVNEGSFGPVTLTPPGTVCTFMPDVEPCLFAYERGSEITLKRDPAAETSDTDFWGGACDGRFETCELKLLADTYVRAGTVGPPKLAGQPLSTFTLRRKGKGGSIQANKGQPRKCTKKSCPLSGVRDGDEIRLTAQSSPKWKFVRWENKSAKRKRFVTVGNLTAAEAIFKRK